MNNINYLSTHALIISSAIAILIMHLRIRKRSGAKWILSYPFSIKIISAAGLLFVYTGVSVLVELTPGIAAKCLVILLSIPAGILVFMAAAEVFASETSYDDSVLCQCSPWRPRVSLPFHEVVRIENALLRIQYSVHSNTGQVIRVCKWTERSDEVLGYAQEGLDEVLAVSAEK